MRARSESRLIDIFIESVAGSCGRRAACSDPSEEAPRPRKSSPELTASGSRTGEAGFPSAARGPDRSTTTTPHAHARHAHGSLES
ncbi:unnamed protein product [Lampetra planeri]